MRKPRFISLVMCCWLTVCLAQGARAQTVNPDLPDGFQDQIVLGGLDQPTSFEFLPDERILITERRTGLIRLVVADTVHSSDPIALIPNIETINGEEGLLGLAVDPRWPAEPYIYIHYTSAETALIFVERYTVTGDLDFSGDGGLNVDMASRHRVLNAPNDALFHNGGTLAFGPDSMLLVCLGDDGGNCAAMDLTQLKGKILRIDVRGLPAGPGGPPPFNAITPPDNPFNAHPDTVARLVHTYGIRNPFSMKIDHPTGDLFIADVGGVDYEELNWVPVAGMNYGWPLWEGPKRRNFSCPGADTTLLVHPIAYYPNPQTAGGAAIVTAGAYRAPAGASQPWPAEYERDVLYGDFGQEFMRRVSYDGANWAPEAAPGQPDADNWGTGEPWISDFEIGSDGSLWYVRMWADFFGQGNTGRLRRIVYAPPTGVEPFVSSGLLRVVPQPSRSGVTVAFNLQEPSRVELSVVDVSGRVVRPLVGGRVLAGSHRYIWDGFDAGGGRAAPGVYFAVLRTADRVESVRIVRLD